MIDFIKKLLNPVDYLRLLYLSLFKTSEGLNFEKDTKIILLLNLQKIFLLLFINLIIEIVSFHLNDTFSPEKIWYNLFFTVLVGITNTISRIEDDLNLFKITKAITKSSEVVLFGLLFSILHAITDSISASVISCVILYIDSSHIRENINIKAIYGFFVGLLSGILTYPLANLIFKKTQNNTVDSIIIVYGLPFSLIFSLFYSGGIIVLSLLYFFKKNEGVKELIFRGFEVVCFTLLFVMNAYFSAIIKNYKNVHNNESILFSSQLIKEAAISGLIIVFYWICCLLFAKLSKKLNQCNSIKNSILFSVFLLIVMSFWMGYTYRLFALWYGFSSPDPLLTTLLIFVLSTRLFLWPLEGLWALGLTWCYERGYLGVQNRHLSEVIDLAYFDRRMILPLPKEKTYLHRLVRLNIDEGWNKALELATQSKHLIASVGVLHSFACIDPISAQIEVNKAFVKSGIYIYRNEHIKQILRYISYRLPAASANVWQGEEQFKDLYVDLLTQFTPKEVKLKESGFSYRELEEIDISAVIEVMEQVVKKFESVRQADSQIPNVQQHYNLYNAILISLQCIKVKPIFEWEIILESDSDYWHRTLIETFDKINTISELFKGYLEASSPLTKRNCLLEANEQLTNLDNYLAEEKVVYHTIFRLIVSQWQKIVADEGGKLARSGLGEPVSNPYVIGNPVQGNLFIGREDILQRLEELWSNKDQCSSVVLYGHRRMGKSSILQNIGTRFGTKTIIVYFNMQSFGKVKNNNELLWNLARKIHRSWCQRGNSNLEAPNKTSFLEDSPYMMFDDFLLDLDQVRDGHRFIITVDEYEWIEKQINEGRLDPDLLEHWRGTFQTYHWFIMAFAGLHSLEEKRRDYWHPLYSSIKSIPVSFLSSKSAEHLITYPSPIDYDRKAIERIIQLTNGQPYLVQLIGYFLISRFNQQMFEEEIQRQRRLTLEDVEAVINSPEFSRDINAYCEGVWVQAKDSQPDGQLEILKQLCNQQMSLAELAEITHLSLEETEAALETLKKHDVIVQNQNKYVYTVELMRRWVQQRKK
ncbi:ATP-binding protein [Limnoraphis robusta]|uniref:ATP-binding protein n=1 Tax=Limnoraphis robusta TaxID=1118279 RepID=UPI002B1EF6D8|nr:ATP-binding protein [Limnoraphis robusta]MEA5501202.1 ATP-binding protein [Limnoraphis robusta BA-68 BA1]